MTWIWSGPESERGKATRPTTMRLVPSQFTERHQATDVPEVWPVDEQSVVEMVTEWYLARRWPAAVLLLIGCAAAGLVIARYGWAVGEMVRR